MTIGQIGFHLSHLHSKIPHILQANLPPSLLSVDNTLSSLWNMQASTYLDNIQTTQEHLHENLKKANNQYKTQADKSRIRAPKLMIGNKVWLDSSTIRTT